MPLNSLDVQNKSFNPQFRGFNKQEVDEFLDIIVNDYDEFAQKIKEQELELKALRERVKYFDDMKESLNKSIIVAQDAADNLRLQAQNEASNILAEASNKSQLIVESAKKEAGIVLNFASDDARRLIRDTDDLKRKMRLYHQRMTSIIENQLASVQAEDWVEALKPNSTDYLFNPEEKLQEILDITVKEHEENVEKIISEAEEAISDVPTEDVIKIEDFPTFSEEKVEDMVGLSDSEEIAKIEDDLKNVEEKLGAEKVIDDLKEKAESVVTPEAEKVEETGRSQKSTEELVSEINNESEKNIQD